MLRIKLINFTSGLHGIGLAQRELEGTFNLRFVDKGPHYTITVRSADLGPNVGGDITQLDSRRFSVRLNSRIDGRDDEVNLISGITKHEIGHAMFGVSYHSDRESSMMFADVKGYNEPDPEDVRLGRRLFGDRPGIELTLRGHQLKDKVHKLDDRLAIVRDMRAENLRTNFKSNRKKKHLRFTSTIQKTLAQVRPLRNQFQSLVAAYN